MTLNLDLEAQNAAQEIAARRTANTGKIVRAALAIVQEQGLFAAALYAYTKEKSEGAIVAEPLFEVASKIADPNEDSFRVFYTEFAQKVGITNVLREGKAAKQEIESAQRNEAQARVALAENRLRYISEKLACNLHTTLLVKQVWEQTLIYARYACKLYE